MSVNDSKRYYWLRLHRDFFKRHDTRIIESMENGKDYLLFYLKLLVESIDHDGYLRFSETIPYNDSMLATITNTNVDVVRTAVKVFTELGMMEQLDDGTLYMAQVEKMIGSETGAAKRMRASRDAKCIEDGDVGNNVPDCHKIVHQSKSKSKSKSKREDSASRHPQTGLLMNQTRYDRLCDEYGQPIVDDYISRVDAWAANKNRQIKDVAGYAENWLKRDEVAKKQKVVKVVSNVPEMGTCPTCRSTDIKQLHDQLVCFQCDSEFIFTPLSGWNEAQPA